MAAGQVVSAVAESAVATAAPGCGSRVLRTNCTKHRPAAGNEPGEAPEGAGSIRCFTAL